MSINFFAKQSDDQQKLYISLLEIVGSLSNLYTDSQTPYLYYRVMENVFCKAFEANNLSRSDVSADASKNNIGIGLKTFLQNNGNTYQKIAEFNKVSYLLKDLNSIELIKKISQMRNDRINFTMKAHNLSDMIYHLITRSNNYMAIYEEHMDFIDVDSIKIKSKTQNTIRFTDKLNEYNYSLSKNTLLKRFNTAEHRKIYGFNVEVLSDPFEFLLSIKEKNVVDYIEEPNDKNVVDYIVLPLYSSKNNKVEERSGLNHWNAKGRKRDKNEVYVSIPKWIHRIKKGFFAYTTNDNRTDSFEVSLPNGSILNMKVAQQGGKALMSNPNSALGKWLLRDVLELADYQLVTKELLDSIGIDSIKLSKMIDGTYKLDFLKSGSFEIFEENHRL